MNQSWYQYSCRIDGWMFPEELSWLYHQAVSRRTILEIGVWKGRSTSAIAAGCLGKVLAIDHWQGSPEERQTFHAALRDPALRAGVITTARQNLACFENLTVLEADVDNPDTKAAVLKWLDGKPLDMLFLDGGHDYGSVSRNLDTYFPLVSLDGITCGHDYTWEGVAKAVNERFGSLKMLGPGSIWYFTP